MILITNYNGSVVQFSSFSKLFSKLREFFFLNMYYIPRGQSKLCIYIIRSIKNFFFLNLTTYVFMHFLVSGCPLVVPKTLVTLITLKGPVVIMSFLMSSQIGAL